MIANPVDMVGDEADAAVGRSTAMMMIDYDDSEQESLCTKKCFQQVDDILRDLLCLQVRSVNSPNYDPMCFFGVQCL